jgi:ribonuclease HI
MKGGNDVLMYFTYENFVNHNVVNIFTDASMIKHYNGITSGCYGAIVCCNGKIIDSEYRIMPNCTNNNAEIRAIRSGVNLAIKWRNLFPYLPVFNLFSDSQISVLGIREYIYGWKYNESNLISKANTPVKNQSIFLEIVNLIVNSGLYINFFHQKGHVKLNNYGSINNAIHVFINANGVTDKVETKFIKYISRMNNLVDDTTRKQLQMVANWDDFNKEDVFEFTPFDHKNKLKQYNILQGSRYYI